MTIEVIQLCDVICLLLIIISIHAVVVYKDVESTFCLFILMLQLEILVNILLLLE